MFYHGIKFIFSKQAELTKDLEKVKQARMAREHERSMRERERDNEIREQDSARFKDSIFQIFMAIFYRFIENKIKLYNSNGQNKKKHSIWSKPDSDLKLG